MEEEYGRSLFFLFKMAPPPPPLHPPSAKQHMATFVPSRSVFLLFEAVRGFSCSSKQGMGVGGGGG